MPIIPFVLNLGSPAGKTITADTGSFSISSAAATLRVGHHLTTAAGNFTYTGFDITFKRRYQDLYVAGFYSIIGSPVTLSVTTPTPPPPASTMALDGSIDIVPKFGGLVTVWR